MPSPRTLDEAVARERLPDLEIAGLDPAARAAIGRAWLEHAASERAEAISMARAAAYVLEREGPGDLHWIAARGAADELRHAAICAHVARAYAGDLAPLPAARHFASVPVAIAPEHARALHVIVQCCVQETLAAAYLERAFAAAEVALPRAALRVLFGDEIDHGRIGYAFAETLSTSERTALRAPVATLLEVCVATWRERARALPTAAAPEHGVLAASTIEQCVRDAAQRLVRPGLSRAGLG